MAFYKGTNGVDSFNGGLAAIADVMIGLAGSDTLRGGGGNDTINGGSGADTLIGDAGNDYLDGGSGNDVLAGRAGQDYLLGGSGNDTFDYNATSESPTGAGSRDVIFDFQGNGAGVGDKIDLRGIDTRTGPVGDQAFTYINGNAYSGTAGELRYAGGVLAGDVNGDGMSDFHIELIDAPALSVGGAGTDILL